MKKLILTALSALVLLTGCNSSSSTYDSCKSAGYKGIAIQNEVSNPHMYCSDGEVINNKIKANGKLLPIHSQKQYTYRFMAFNTVKNVEPIKIQSSKSSLTLNTITLLKEAAKTCNKAKIVLITKSSNITEEDALSIIKDCSLYSLEKELQQ